jgi:hypothetical protein
MKQFREEVTIMKTFMTIASMIALTLAFGLVYADEFPIANRDVGTELYLSAFPTHDSTAVKDFGVIGKREPEAAEVGTALYNDMIKDSMVAKSEVEGSAAGGAAKDDERTIIWDNLLGAPGGSDLP